MRTRSIKPEAALSSQTRSKDGFALDRQLRLPLTILSPAAFALALAWLAFEVGRYWGVAGPDIKYFWLAGEFWTAGLTPYEEAFTARLIEITDIEGGAGAWNYTPNWYFISAGLAQMDLLTASRLWLVMNAVMLLAASALNAAAFRPMNKNSAVLAPAAPVNRLAAILPLLVLFFLHGAYMGLSQPAEKTLELGQSSILIYFGLSLLVWSISRERLYAGAAGLAIVMLKPQFGALIVTVLLFSTMGRRITFVAAIISILMALPAFLVSQPFEIASDLLHNLGSYDGQIFNTAVSTTGLRNVVWTLGGDDLGMMGYQLMALAFIASVAAFLYLRRGAPPRTVDMVMFAVAAAHVFAPYHYYDFVLMGVLIYFCASLRTASALICMAAFLLILRAGNLPNIPSLQGEGVMAYGGNLYMTLAAGVILIVMLRELFREPAQPNA